MPLVLVWAGEHYVVDTLLGALYAGAVGAASDRARPRRRAARCLPWTRDRSPFPTG